jgi:hypothetical protein
LKTISLHNLAANQWFCGRLVKKLERAEDKERMMIRFNEEEPSGAPVSLRYQDGESTASAAE